MAVLLTWIICLAAIAGVIARPFRIAEVWWAVGGALLLVVLGRISPAGAWSGVGKGTDVYLFLTGMMLLAETAREEQLFDWFADHATRMARGSSGRLFFLLYAVGTVVTVFLSNDATAVVLTPAVAAAVRSAKVRNPLPYVLICAFIANAASFVLPISNPANLVIYGAHMPPLWRWLAAYTVPSVLSVVATYGILYATQRRSLRQPIESEIAAPALTAGGKAALAGIAVTMAVLLAASALDVPLGLPTAVTGVLISGLVLARSRRSPAGILRGVSWAVLPMVAGLFVVVEALRLTGVVDALAEALRQAAGASEARAAWIAGLATAFGCNGMNNLPAGLIAGNVVQAARAPELVRRMVLVGIDLGPNLSVTGSLATILWLTALRREGIAVSGAAFFKVGVWVMTGALLLTLGAVYLSATVR